MVEDGVIVVSPSHMFISFTLVVVGLVLYLVACKLPMNLLFGFRIGYTLSSKRLWVKYNRLSGLTLVLAGLISLALSIFVTNTTLYTCIVLGLIVTPHILLARMASREAEIELSFREVEGGEKVERRFKKIEPVPPSRLRVLLALLPPIISLTATLYLLPLLPERIPVHYDVKGFPDRWETLEEFLKITAPYMIGLQCIALIFMVVELRAPMIFYTPRLPKEKLVNLMYDTGIMVAWTLLLSYLDLLYYSINNTHLLPMPLRAMIDVAVVAIIVARATILWVKWRRIIRQRSQEHVEKTLL